MKKITNNQFLEKLAISNNYYAAGDIVILSCYESIDTPIIFLYQGFKYKMTPYNLLKNRLILFNSCIEKEKFLQQYLNEGEILKTVGPFSYVQSAYGICKIFNQNIKKGVGPGLKNAINSHHYFLNCLNNVNSHYKKRKFRIISTYKNYNSHVLVENKYGKCKITVGHLLQGKNPSLESAINKDVYFKNLMIEIYGDIYKYKKITKNSFRKYVDFKCSKHGWVRRPWKLFYTFKTACLQCNKDNFVGRGFTKEKYINVCNGRNSFLYLLSFKSEKEEFYKIGLTLRTIQERFYGNTYKITVVFKKEGSPSDVFEAERQLHEKYKKYKYLPSTKFSGHTECYDLNLPITTIIEKYA